MVVLLALATVVGIVLAASGVSSLAVLIAYLPTLLICVLFCISAVERDSGRTG